MKLSITGRLVLGFLVLTGLIVASVGASIWKVGKINTIADRIESIRIPSARTSADILNNVNSSIAALQGYMLTGDSKLQDEHKKIWQEIDANTQRMDTLSLKWTDSANLEKWREFKVVLSDFRAAQSAVDLISHSTEELPASKLMKEKAYPIAEAMLDSIDDLIEMEKGLPATTERETLLATLLDTRNSAANGLVSLKAYLHTGDDDFRMSFDAFWQRNSINHSKLQEINSVLSSDQREALAAYSSQRAEFKNIVNNMLNIRNAPRWNMAIFTLTTEVIPRAERLEDILLGVRNANGQRIGGMTNNQQQFLDRDSNSSSKAINDLLFIEWSLMIIGLGLSVSIAYPIIRSIKVPIEEMTDAMERLSKGELETPIPTLGTADELGSMAQALQIFKATAIDVNRLATGELEFQKHALDEHSIVSIADVRGDITYVNDKFCAISGYSREELLGNNHRIVKSSEHPKAFFVDMWKTIANGKTWQGEIQNISKGGEPYWVKTTIVPKMNEEGKPVQYLGIRTEITEDKLKERELLSLTQDLSASKEELEKAAKTKENFLAAMSHEIRTPMAGVIGMANLILEQDLSTEAADWAKGIKSSGKHLMKILGEILDQSKLDAGRIEIETVDIHLPSFIEQLSNLYVPNIASKGLRWNFVIDETIPEGVRLDPLRVTQVLSNLFSNALKFTAEGSITLDISKEASKDGEFKLKFSVKDTGIGLSKTERRKLFTPFTQADNSTSRLYGGTGLGLSISKQLVELMGGEIAVSSVKGVGSNFYFSIESGAAIGNVEPYNKAEEILTWQAARPIKILVAEDTKVIQAVIRKLLGNLGHEVTIVDNGMEALTALAKDDFELVLMDIRMPVMDGIEATNRIRAGDDKKAKIPIIALTADVSVGNIQEYRDAGLDQVCAKPIDLPDLLQAIDKQLGEDIHHSQGEDTSEDLSPFTEYSQSTRGIDNVESPVNTGNIDLLLKQIKDEPIGNKKSHAELVQLFGDEDYRGTLEQSIVALDTLMQEIRDGIDSKDIYRIQLAAHSLKGFSATMVAPRLLALSGAINQNPSIATDLFADLELTAKETQDWWKKTLKK